MSTRFSRNIKIMFYMLFFIIFLKILFAIFMLDTIQALSYDAEGYHLYATGKIIADPENMGAWANTLKALNNLGIYNRSALTYIIFLICNIVIPIKLASIVQDKRQKNTIYSVLFALMASTYPSLFFYSLDITRDIPMLFLFLLGVSWIKNYFLFKKLWPLLSILFLSYILFLLRNYLGAAFLFAFILSFFIKINRCSFIFLAILCVIFVHTILPMDIMDGIIKYRNSFSTTSSGNSNIGILLSKDDTLWDFSIKLFSSSCSQLLGLHFNSISAVLIFASESIPFITCFIFLMRNLKFNNDQFISFLLLFFLFYSCVFVVANDNLGTAVRIRFFSYMSIYIAYFHIACRFATGKRINSNTAHEN